MRETNHIATDEERSNGPKRGGTCEACNGLGYLPNFERCDACEKYASDHEALDAICEADQWADHPNSYYNRKAWKQEVANDDTQRGYWDWLHANLAE